MATRHFGLGQWTDYVRDLTSAEEAVAMTEHLEQGCDKCNRVVESLRLIVDTGESELGPPRAVSDASSDLGPEQSEMARQVMELVWDSARAPFLRSGDAEVEVPGRQLHFANSEFELDARVEAAEDQGTAMLLGRLHSRYRVAVTALKVSLVSADRIVDSIATSESGEFELPLAVGGDPVELCIALDEHRELVATLGGD